MKFRTSVWVAAVASWVLTGSARADESAAPVVAAPVATVAPVAAPAPVAVPTQEAVAEPAPAPVEPLVPPPVTPPAPASAPVATPAPASAPVATPAPSPAAAPAPAPAFVDPFAPKPIAVWADGVSGSSAAPKAAEPVVVAPPAPPYQNPYGPHHRARTPEDYRLGVGMMFGGGVSDFSSSLIRDMTGTGGAWDARLIFGQREVLALETAYVGSAHNIRALGLDDDALLVSNGAEGVLRLNIPIIDGDSIIEPFGFVGLGWSRYELTQTTYNHSDLNEVDDVLEVPYGAGLTMGSGGFLVDIRFTYRATYYDNLMHMPPSTSASTAGQSQRLDSWSLGGHVGFEF